MSSWYKRAYSKGIPLADQYEMRDEPLSSKHITDDTQLTRAVPQFGGDRDSLSREREDENWSKTHGQLPGESVLMDREYPSEGVGKEDFTDDIDKGSSLGKKIDNVDIGPHNMSNYHSLFKKIRPKAKINTFRI